MNEAHPAITASKNSWKAVKRKVKKEWLDLFSENAIIEDPVGPSPIDPDGLGHQGPDKISAFWDTNISPNNIDFNINKSYACGHEAAHTGVLTITFQDGSKMTVEGVFIYRVDDMGKIISLRAFWEFDKAMETLTKA